MARDIITLAAVAFVFKVSTDQWEIRNATFFLSFSWLFLLPSQREIGPASLAELQYLVCILLLLCLLECDLFEVKGLDIHDTCLHKIVFLMNKRLNRLNFYQENNALYFLTILNRVKGRIKTLLGTSKQVFFEIFFSCVWYIHAYVYKWPAINLGCFLSLFTLCFEMWSLRNPGAHCFD